MCKLDLVKLRSAQKVPRFDIRHPFEVTSWLKGVFLMTKMFIMPWNGLDATLHLCLLFSMSKTVPAFAPNSDTFKRLKKNNWKKLDWGSKVTTFSKNLYKLATSSAWEKAFLLLQMLSAQSFLKWLTKQQSINEQICLQQTNILAMVLPLFLASASWQDYIR